MSNKGDKLTQKQERFVQNLFVGMSQRVAYIEAGYSSKQLPAVLDVRACELAKASKIQVRLAELKKKAEDNSVMGVLERRQRLTEIARAKITDYTEMGKDGTWTDITGETKNPGAIAELHSRTEADKHGNTQTIYTSVKLHDPQRAIDLLNKMDGSYAPVRQEITGKDGGPIKTESSREILISRINRIIAIRTEGGTAQLTNGRTISGTSLGLEGVGEVEPTSS